MTPMEVRQKIHRLVCAVKLACNPGDKIRIVRNRIEAIVEAGQAVPKELGWIENRLRIELADAA
ncbi:MAG: hypothetical protein CBC34_020420 [Hyphomicrobiaceae bacterium TMED74]|nr:hypothetical protein [Filomicrobium sp.]RPG36117.1 MAG: hypothetical protein CBC34_020420 [Hyphomicrobiaceae bacterium TMED74]